MIIKNASIYANPCLKDLEIKGELIYKIGEKLKGDESFDAKGAILLPSFVDLCVNIKDTNSLNSLEKKAIKAGFSHMLLRGDFDKDFLNSLAKSTSKLGFYALVRGVKNAKLQELSALKDAGAKGFLLASDDDFFMQIKDYALLKKALLFLSLEDKSLDINGMMNEGFLNPKLGLSGISERAELGQLARSKELIAKDDLSLVYENISLKASLAKLEARNTLFFLPHLLKDENSVKGFETEAKIYPPLRKKSDQLALKDALSYFEDSYLSAFYSQGLKKNLSFENADFGNSTLSDYARLLNSFLSDIGWEKLAKFFAKNPAKLLGLNTGEIKEGFEANFFLFDPLKKQKGSKLYKNDSLKGEIIHHFIKGKKQF